MPGRLPAPGRLSMPGRLPRPAGCRCPAIASADRVDARAARAGQLPVGRHHPKACWDVSKGARPLRRPSRAAEPVWGCLPPGYEKSPRPAATTGTAATATRHPAAAATRHPAAAATAAAAATDRRRLHARRWPAESQMRVRRL